MLFHRSHVACYTAKAPSCEVLVQLQHLNVSSNGLEGSLPETWRNLTSVSLVVAFYALLL